MTTIPNRRMHVPTGVRKSKQFLDEGSCVAPIFVFVGIQAGFARPLQ